MPQTLAPKGFYTAGEKHVGRNYLSAISRQFSSHERSRYRITVSADDMSVCIVIINPVVVRERLVAGGFNWQESKHGAFTVLYVTSKNIYKKIPKNG